MHSAPFHPLEYISIHAPREGSDVRSDTERTVEAISIHAPREGSDVDRRPHKGALGNFNPRSP